MASHYSFQELSRFTSTGTYFECEDLCKGVKCNYLNRSSQFSKKQKFASKFGLHSSPHLRTLTKQQMEAIRKRSARCALCTCSGSKIVMNGQINEAFMTVAKSIALEAKPKRYGDFLPISAFLSHYGEIQKTHLFLFYFNFFVWNRC